MKKKQGRPIDKTGINVGYLKKWIRKHASMRAIIKCQALVSLAEGASVSETCRVLCVTRESLRIWRKVLREEGPDGLFTHKRTGRKTKLTNQIKEDLKVSLVQTPFHYGLDGDKWNGRLVCKYIETKWGLAISLRTSHYWIKKIRLAK